MFLHPLPPPSRRRRPLRAPRDIGPAHLTAEARCQPQGGHGLPQGCLQREKLGVPDEGEERY